MPRSLMPLLGLIFAVTTALPAHAHTASNPNAKDHDHATSDRHALPTGTQLTLRGESEPNKLPCELFVLDSNLTNAAPSARVMASLTHQNDEPEAIVIAARADRPELLFGIGTNGKDEIAVQFKARPFDWSNATAFNYRWWHRNHFDTLRCRNLKVVQP